MTFWGAIIFGAIYWVYYTFGGGPTLTDELKVAMSELPKVSDSLFVDADLEKKSNEPGALEKGKAVFAGKCAACHGVDGQGVIGPNLTDNFWINGGGTRSGIATTISKGVLDKGMPAWAGQISDEELIQVASFVYSIKGTNPANPKAPQGVEVQ